MNWSMGEWFVGGTVINLHNSRALINSERFDKLLVPFSQEFSQTMALRLKLLLPRIPDEVTRQQTSLKISQIIPYFPDQARSLRRLNCVDQKRDFDDLDARMDKYKDICEAISQTMDIIFSTLQSCIQVQMGTSCSNAGIISQNHGDNEDMET